jgi:hypothetical protein
MLGTIDIEEERSTRLFAGQLWQNYRARVGHIGLLAIYVLATVQFIGAYQFLEFPYVDLYRFEHGYERLPFQTRLLVAPLYRWADGNATLVSYAARLSRNNYFFPHGVRAGDVMEFFVDILCVLFAGWVVRNLYRAASHSRLLEPLVYPLFLALCAMAYILHTVQNFRYVYDMPSLAFFAAGYYLIYFRKPALWFAALFAVATLNRETILLLLPFYMLSEAVAPEYEGAHSSFRWHRMVAPSTLAVVLPLAIYWALWHHIVFSLFAGNASEYYARVEFNIRCFLRLRYYPQLFSCLGFLVPFLWLGRRFVADRQLRVWLWCVPVWYSLMFTWGILVETRIFGELLPFVAAYTAIMAEEWLAARLQASPFASLYAERPALVSSRRAA